ncbi:unnamed protein product [Orchesella dallaii]|uniref:PRKR-interacting protein 1 n=1 Tax=Orchesella dallaii TaxID=48710 RepID=A0ABP1QFQ1_9HEXA
MSLNLNLSPNPPASQPNEDGTGGKKKKRKLDLPIVPIKNTADYQRMKLQRLMANPDKPVMIPNRPKDKSLPTPPDFVRNVMGSSAGAGSGEFHVYRHLRRKEYARQKCITESAKLEEEEMEFQRKIEDHKKEAELKTAKKRAKRLKKKMKAKQKGKGKSANGNNKNTSSQSESSSEESENENEVTGSDSCDNNNDSSGAQESSSQTEGPQSEKGDKQEELKK